MTENQKKTEADIKQWSDDIKAKKVIEVGRSEKPTSDPKTQDDIERWSKTK